MEYMAVVPFIVIPFMVGWTVFSVIRASNATIKVSGYLERMAKAMESIEARWPTEK